MCGPNSEIGWNREGSRGFALLPRSTPQTALALLADKAAELGNELNAKLPVPEGARRLHVIGATGEREETVAKVADLETATSGSNMAGRCSDTIRPQCPLEPRKKMHSTPKSTMSKSAELCAAIKSSASRKRGASKASISTPSTRSIALPSPRKVASPPMQSQPKPLVNRRRKSEMLAMRTANTEQQSESFDCESEGDAFNGSEQFSVPQRISVAERLRLQPGSIESDSPPLPIKVLKTSSSVAPAGLSQRNPPSPVASKSISSPKPPPLRVPPKINILSQQTITKNNINFMPVNENNKIIIPSDSRLANALKSQAIQMIPAAKSAPPPVKHVVAHTTGTAMNATRNRYHSPKMYVVNMARQSPNTTIPAHETHTIEKVITEDTPVDIMPIGVASTTSDTDDIIIEEGAVCEVEDGAEESYEGITYISRHDEAIPAKIVKYVNNGNGHMAYDATTQHLVEDFGPGDNSVVAANFVYEESADEPEWDYEVELNGNHHVNGSTDNEQHEYQDSNIFYNEEEVIEEEHVQEEYVTAEVFAPNGEFGNAMTSVYGHKSISYFSSQITLLKWKSIQRIKERTIEEKNKSKNKLFFEF